MGRSSNTGGRKESAHGRGRGRGRGRRLPPGRGRIQKSGAKTDQSKKKKKRDYDGTFKFEALENQGFKEEFWRRIYEANGQKYTESGAGAGLAGRESDGGVGHWSLLFQSRAPCVRMAVLLFFLFVFCLSLVPSLFSPPFLPPSRILL